MPRASVTSKYWTFMFYNDQNEYERLLEELTSLGLKCALSPLHDKDIDPKSDTGDLKKAHTHVVVKFVNPVGRRAVVDGITKQFQGATNHVQQILNPAKMIDYLTHENQPEKHHYDAKDIIWINGASMEDFPDEYQLSKKERKAKEDMDNILEILDLIDKENPITLLQLSRLLKSDPEKLKFVVDHSFYFDRVLHPVSTP